MSQKNKSLLISILIIIIGASLFIVPPIDPDFGWHFKYGEYFLSNGKLLRENIYSYTHSNYLWANSYWLSQIIIFMLYSGLGIIGMNLILNILALALVFATILRNASFTAKVVALAIFAQMANLFYISVRPLYFSTLFILIQNYILLKKPSQIKYLPFMYLLWANFHPDFIPGLMILAVFSLYKYLVEERNLKHLVVLFLSFFATLANPSGLNLFVTLTKDAGSVSSGVVTEFSTITLSYAPTILHLLAGSLLASLYYARHKFPKWFLLISVLFFIISAKAPYFYRIFVILTLFTVPYNIEQLISFLKESIKIPKTVYKFYVGFFLLLTVLIGIKNIVVSSDVYQWTSSAKFPLAAVSYIKENPPEGKMLNSYVWGGYLIWQLPEYQTFIDGRMASWVEKDGISARNDYLQFTGSPKENRALLTFYLEKYNIGWALLSKARSQTFIDYLVNDLHWPAVYEDREAIILMKPGL